MWVLLSSLLWFACSLFTPSQGLAYCRARTDTSKKGVCEVSDAPVLFWGRGCISYVFHENVFPGLLLLSELEIRTIVRDSFTTWGEVNCGRDPFVIEQLAGTTDAPAVLFRNGIRNEFVISVMSAAEWEAQSLDPDAFAITYLWFRANTGEIFDADMALSLAQGQFGDCTNGCTRGTIDLQNTVTHEAGHVLGLGHSKIDGATMKADATVGATFMRDLDTDDIAGMCALELPSHSCEDGTTTCQCPPPPILGGATSATNCSVQPGKRKATPTWHLLPLLAAAAGCWYRRRQRRRA